MKEQKALFISGDSYDSDKEDEINRQLELGWKVVSVTAQKVAGTNEAIYGGYLIILEQEKRKV